ncbi:MAG: Gfo/Idh/MocA family oxidoreductase [Pirellulaceae bacterium]|nr:Gfo/Idh/MocA family oxidoreductase [Pirellulaceae bacterium]
MTNHAFESRCNRRRFQFAMAGLALSPTLARLQATLGEEKKLPPSDRIRVGIIGLGSRGFNLLDDLLSLNDVEVAVVCDVDRLHYRDRPRGKGPVFGRDAAQNHVEKKSGRKPQTAVDYREVCHRDDLDAIVIATPDHWHALCTLTALRAGKAVYCEKPITHWFHEGLAVCEEVKRRKAVFQTGSQQRSDAEFRQAVELVRNGVLGKVLQVEVGLPSGYETPQAETEIVAPPEGLDYNFWCGPAPLLPYMRARHHRWWRGNRAFGGGVLMDWIGHHNDIAHWVLDMDQSGPTRVEAVDWKFPTTELYDTPWHYTIRCDYANGVSSTISDQHAIGTKIVGEDGWLHVTRGKLTTSTPAWSKPDFRAGSFQIPVSPGHMRNFIDCIKSRETCIAPAETAHRSISPGHLGFVSSTLQRPLHWNPSEQRIINDPEADKLLRSGDYREPWGRS